MGNRKSCLTPGVIAELTHNTNFSRVELNNLYRQYRHDCNRQGFGLRLTINRKMFLQIYGEIFPDGDSTKFAEHVFRTFDTDENGVIDFKEFITHLNIQMKGSFEDKLIWLFDLYDLDRSEDISYDEAYKVINVLFDLNSGLIPNENEINPKYLTEHLFKQAHELREGKVDRQFFYRIALESTKLRTLFEATVACATQPFIARRKRSTLHPSTQHCTQMDNDQHKFRSDSLLSTKC